MKTARYIFGIAGIYGILVMAPLYFTLEKTGIDYPPPITHPEYYYGFVGMALVFQLVFLMIAADPIRYRPLMLVSLLEKLSFGIPTTWMYLQGKVSGPVVIGGAIDLVLFVLFLIAYFATPKSAGS
jgi:hypothetical protein